MDILIKTEAFEGPLALLCNLIEKNEMNIYDISIALLTDQYLETVNSFAAHVDMDIMSEFVLMAATLIEIKSKMLLPVPAKGDEGEETDPRDELVRKLIEYKKFKEIAEILKVNEAASSKMIFKAADSALPRDITEQKKIAPFEILDGISLDVLYKAFMETLNRRESRTDKIRGGFNSVSKDMYTVEEKSEHIMNLLVIYEKVLFESVFSPEAPKIEMIVTFLALLELIKIKKIKITQESAFSEINIHRYRSV